jgi:hypothetical protein
MLFVADYIPLIQQIPYKEALEGSGDFKIGGQVICTVRYAGDLCYWLRTKLCYRT